MRISIHIKEKPGAMSTPEIRKKDIKQLNMAIDYLTNERDSWSAVDEALEGRTITYREALINVCQAIRELQALKPESNRVKVEWLAENVEWLPDPV
jgi:hypothetical protein